VVKPRFQRARATSNRGFMSFQRSWSTRTVRVGVGIGMGWRLGGMRSWEGAWFGVLAASGGMRSWEGAWFGVLAGAVGGYDFAGDFGDLDVAALGFLAQALQRVVGVAA
jgi:hypothetical protein